MAPKYYYVSYEDAQNLLAMLRVAKDDKTQERSTRE